MPSEFRTKVKELKKGGSTRLDALKGAKAAMANPLTSRQQKRYDRGVKKLTPSPTTPPSKRAEIREDRKKKHA